LELLRQLIAGSQIRPAVRRQVIPGGKAFDIVLELFPAPPATIMVSQDRRASAKEGFMRIFIFKSEAKPDLRAFGGDLAGSQLPSQFKPWRAVGAVAPDQQPPYKLSRDVIERAIKDQGFQLFRLSKAE
jgi:hypothetical protein